MPNPAWLKDNRQPRRLVAKCFGCAHCGKTVRVARIRGKQKEFRECRLHGIPCSDSQDVCTDGTNKELFANTATLPPQKAGKTGCENY